MKKTLRLTFPQWQGGMDPDYVFGAELLAAIAPPSMSAENAVIKVNEDFYSQHLKHDEVDCGAMLLEQAKETEKTLAERQPDKVIVFGGDCSVTQIPFDYLKGRYGDEIGLLWLDAHPDCSTTKESAHLHEMVMGNLIGLSPDSELTGVRHPYSKEKVLFAGLIEEELRPMDMACVTNKLRIVTPEVLKESDHEVISWIKETKIRYLAVHWDLDVLSPLDFRSIYPAEPYTDPCNFPAAVGKMKLEEIVRLLGEASKYTEIVGLSITEHLPWDALNLRKALGKISIFE